MTSISLTDEQRKQIMDYVQQPIIKYLINNSQMKGRILRAYIHVDLGINISSYTCAKLVDFMLKESLIPATKSYENVVDKSLNDNKLVDSLFKDNVIVKLRKDVLRCKKSIKPLIE